MKRTTIFVDEHLEHDLRVLSKRSGRPVAALVREAMERYVSTEHDALTTPLGFEAAGRSGHSDTAERHESLLWSELKPHGQPKRAEQKTTRRRSARRTGSR
jgi:hypothetical protein